MSAVQDVLMVSSYHAFYDLIACALETHNPEQAARRITEARVYLPQSELNSLVAELEHDYYEFT